MSGKINQDHRVVSTLTSARNTKERSVGPVNPKKTSLSIKTANLGGSYGGGSFNVGGLTQMGTATNIYSPHLSTDFLEMPQNLTEKRSYYRHFYRFHPYVQRAINLHTELPLSKVRLTLPAGKDPDRNREILEFFEDMCKNIKLLERLVEATRDYYIVGEAFLFAEDHYLEFPHELLVKIESEINEEGDIIETEVPYSESEIIVRKNKYMEQHYKGWKGLRILPPEQVHVETIPFVQEPLIELIPDARAKEYVTRAEQGDLQAQAIVEKMPPDIVEYIANGLRLPMDTDPEEGSFVYQLARNKNSYSNHGISILDCIIQALIYQDKLRQAQTSIASRAMTPKRLIHGEDLSVEDVEDLRDQVDMALLDPDYSIITNFPVQWEEISARDRLLDLNSEYDIVDRHLFAGLGVTESMMTGESSYSGERLNIEVINTTYMLYRERIQDFVEEYLFKPVARRKGFIEKENGREKILYPKLSFTRLALRDNQNTFDAMFTLYQKGSLSINYILELFNLDPQAVKERLEQDMWTVNDATFNDMIRTIYSEVGRQIAEDTDLGDRIIEYLKVNKKEDEGKDRFGGR